MVNQKKEEYQEEIKTLDEERVSLEMEIEEKKKKLELTQGSDVLLKEDFDKFNENINKKINE